MNDIEEVYLKGKDFDLLYETFVNVTPAYTYVPTIDELKFMVKDLKKYAVFLLWIEDTGEIMKKYIILFQKL